MVARSGQWVKFIHVVDAQPTGEPLLDASLAALAALATSRKRLMPTDWMGRQPGRSAVDEGLAVLAAQGAVRLYSRRVTSRLTLTELTLLDPDRQAQIRTRLDRYIAAGSGRNVEA